MHIYIYIYNFLDPNHIIYCYYDGNLAIDKCEFSNIVLFKGYIDSSSSLHFHMNFNISLLNFTEESAVSLFFLIYRLIWLRLACLRMLNLPIHGPKMFMLIYS